MIPEIIAMADLDLPVVVELIAAIVGKVRIFDRELLRHSAATEKQIGVTTTELLFLQFVDSDPGLRLSQVAEKLCVQQATSSNVMRSLAQKELIEKRPDPTDGRGVRLHLSAKGKDVVVRSKLEVKGPLRNASKDMSIDELKALNHLLGRVTSNVDESHASAIKASATRSHAAPDGTAQPGDGGLDAQIKTEQEIRMEFAAYFLELKKQMDGEGASVNKAHEWEVFILHKIEEGRVPAEAVAWKCPRSLKAEVERLAH